MSQQQTRWLIRSVAIVAFVGFAILLYLPKYQSNNRIRAIRSALDQRNLAQAMVLLEQHLDRSPADRDSRFLAAQTARRLDDFPAADRHLAQYLQEGGSTEEAELEQRLRRSQLGLQLGPGPLRFCVEHPDHPSVPFMLEAMTRGYLLVGQPRLAVEAADVWLQRDPRPAERAYALYLRSLGLERQGDIPAAIEGYREAVQADPPLLEAWLALATVLLRESAQEALPILQRLEQSGFKPFETRFALGRCYHQLGELEQAAKILAELERQQPEQVAVLTEAARIALDRGQADEAETRLNHALELAPNHRDALVQLARCLQTLGRDAEAQTRLEQLRKLDELLLQKLQSPGMKP